MITWIAEAAGKMSLGGSLFFYTSSQGLLSYLNTKVGLFVYEVDKEGDISANVWDLN